MADDKDRADRGRPSAPRMPFRWLGGRVGPRRATPICGDCTLAGALAGALLGLAPALVGEPGPMLTLFASALGGLTGATVGLLTWIGLSDLPEDRIPPVPESQRMREQRRR